MLPVALKHMVFINFNHVQEREAVAPLKRVYLPSRIQRHGALRYPVTARNVTWKSSSHVIKGSALVRYTGISISFRGCEAQPYVLVIGHGVHIGGVVFLIGRPRTIHSTNAHHSYRCGSISKHRDNDYKGGL